MIAKEINITHTGQILASFIIGLCLCLWTALNMKPSIGVAIGFIPFATLFIFICINRPVILLAITFMLNYLIMGINRYHSIPIAITNIFDLLYGIMLALILLKQLQSNHHFRKILNVYTCITLVWLLYCIINIGNGITGEFYMEAWLRILSKSGKTKRATLQKRRVSKSTKTTRTRKTVSPVLSCMTKAHRFLFV